MKRMSDSTLGAVNRDFLLAQRFQMLIISLLDDAWISVKVTGDSLLIHEFAYSLFIGLCSVTSNMTGYSHSYHSIKLIHCGAPQRDVLSDQMVL